MNGLAVDPLDAALVRLRDGRRVLGAGFLIAPGVVATCAHVIGDAEPIADFPLLGSHGHAVEVLERDDELDVAILRLAEPPTGALPVPARINGDVRDHRFRTFGFPAAESDGVWVTGRLVGAQSRGRIQMAQDTGHWQIEPGFSGAPVWDEELAGVVGMVVTTARNAATAHLVPTTALGDAWTAPTRNPYRGLRSFRQEDSELFRGRDADIERLRQLVDRRDLVAVAGPSGSGKSSLVHAGLVPLLQRDGTRIVELGAHDEIPEATTDTLLVLDQFEEAVVDDPVAARERITELTRALARTEPLRAVLTLRSRSLDDLITRDTVDELNRAVWFLEPMSRQQLAAAIEEPAAHVGGLAFEAGLAQRILDDTSDEPGTLPLVSLVLEQLWENRHGAWLTHQAYEHLGRVPGALSRHADRALPEPGELDGPQQARQKDERRRSARQLLVHLTRPDGEGGYARRSAHLAELGADLREIAGYLAAERLLVIEDQRVNLAHQALIDHWPQLRTWLAEDADFVAWQAKVDDLERSGVLLRGAALDEASRWLGQREQDVPARSASFIRRSTAAQSRSRRRWITITAISTTLALVSAALTAVAISNSAELDRTLRATNSTLIAQEANLATDPDPVTALQLALAAWRESPHSPDAYGALLQQQVAWSGVDRVLPPQLVGEVDDIASNADGHVLVLSPVDPAEPTVVWWDLLGPNPTRREITNVSEGEFELSPDGRFLVLPGDDGLQVWDLSDPDGEPTLLESDPYGPPRFSANSRYLTAVTPHEGNRATTPVKMWDLGTMRELPIPVEADWFDIDAAYPSADGRALITRERRGLESGFITTVVRDRATGADIKTFPPSGTLTSELLGNGTHLSVCTDDTVTVHESFTGTITGRFPAPECNLTLDETGQYLTDINGQVPAAIQWRTGRVLDVAELDDDLFRGGFPVIIAGREGTGTFLDVDHGAVRIATAKAARHIAPPDSTALKARSADGQRWIAYDNGHSIRYDEPDEPSSLVLLDGDATTLGRVPFPFSEPEALAFDASGERVLAATGTTMRIFRTDGLVLEREVRLPGPDARNDDLRTGYSGPPHLLIDPSGEVLVSQSGLLSFWDVRRGEQTAPPMMLEEPPPPPDNLPAGPSMVFRPRHPGQVVVGTENSVSVWNYRTRALLNEFLFPDSQVGAEAPVVSPDGATVAILNAFDGTVTLMDLRSQRVLPQVNGDFATLLGVSAQHLFIQSRTESGTEVWDWHARRRLAAIDFGEAMSPALVDDELVVEQPGYRRVIPLDPAMWFRDLCRVSDRDFTEQEAVLLPAGASRDRPCA
ncbi:serine protease [Saccharopolyspora sp. NFXS83]|uniref:serine protease n=1 Tax=Saccharopolyspora sp. NFXS83 TaxID=2993560 RepID=UPI00224B69F0|nr:serine protease [Saccharopolyspora sp. NFXS83]MCX2732638.1 serine protease [Saccharopolyspora sp. NFXS83]